MAPAVVVVEFQGYLCMLVCLIQGIFIPKYQKYLANMCPGEVRMRAHIFWIQLDRLSELLPRF